MSAIHASTVTKPTTTGCSAPMLLCWRCGTPLISVYACADTSTCTTCGTTTALQAGIWRALEPEQASNFKRFILDYEFIRAAEARGSTGPAYYLALPFEDLTGKLTDQWRVRARTFRHLLRHVIDPIAATHARQLRILDLGAGNGWLSYRIALEGHQPVAVDLLVNDLDGLGAAAHYAAVLPSMFSRVQASVDCLPFPDNTFDLAIFNASFHYSEDFVKTLAEALRCTCNGGLVIIADTPWYAEEESGLAMVQEKHARFLATYGFASNSLQSLEFLTPERLNNIASALDLSWSILKPSYGLKWALRPLRATLQGRRKPSQFRIFTAQVSG